VEKGNVVQTPDGILLSHKKEGRPVVCSNIEPEGVMLSEISQAQTDEYYVGSFLCII
jgi:hypothetical protein